MMEESIPLHNEVCRAVRLGGLRVDPRRLNRSGFSRDQSHWAGVEAADSTSSNRMRAKSKYCVFGRADGEYARIRPSTGDYRSNLGGRKRSAVGEDSERPAFHPNIGDMTWTNQLGRHPAAFEDELLRRNVAPLVGAGSRATVCVPASIRPASSRSPKDASMRPASSLTMRKNCSISAPTYRVLAMCTRSASSVWP